MKNPKFICSYPGNSPVQYGSKFVTTWTGYSIDLIQGPYGTLSSDELRGYEGDEITLSTTANEKYRFKDYSVTGATIEGDTLTIGDQDCSAKANFEKYIFDLKLTQTSGGTISASTLTGQSGTTAQLSYTPSAEFVFKGWNVTGGTVNTSTNKFTFGASDSTAKATFSAVASSLLFTSDTVTAGSASTKTINLNLGDTTFPYFAIRFDWKMNDPEHQFWAWRRNIVCGNCKISARGHIYNAHNYQPLLTDADDLKYEGYHQPYVENYPDTFIDYSTDTSRGTIPTVFNIAPLSAYATINYVYKIQTENEVYTPVFFIGVNGVHVFSWHLTDLYKDNFLSNPWIISWNNEQTGAAAKTCYMKNLRCGLFRTSADGIKTTW